MKAVCAALAILLLSPQEDEAAKKAQRIDRAIEWLGDGDAEVREMGRKELQQLGAAAVPALEKKIAEKGAAELVRMLRLLDRGSSAADAWVAEHDLKEIEADEDFRKASEKLSKDTADKFVYVKYQEALAHARKKSYQRAFDMVNGLIALEPRSTHIDTFKRLRRHCEAMITQTTLIEAKILQPKAWYIEGEAIELAARMKNIYKAPITMTWEKGTEKEPGGGLMVLDVEISMSEVNGNASSDQRHPEFRFEDEVPIAPGAQWEHKFMVDPSTAIADANRIRIVKVGGWVQPMKISTESIGITRKIHFEPALVKILPKRYARLLENPWESFEKAVASSPSMDEIHVCIQLLDAKDHDRAAAILIGKLASAKTLEGKTYAHNLLRALTGQSHGTDARRWEVWLQSRGTEDKDKKKK
jgi:hypothetical protein